MNQIAVNADKLIKLTGYQNTIFFINAMAAP